MIIRGPVLVYNSNVTNNVVYHGSYAGSLSANLIITYIEGSVLTLSASTVSLVCGQNDAGTLRLARNTAATQSLLVNLSSSITDKVCCVTPLCFYYSCIYLFSKIFVRCHALQS